MIALCIIFCCVKKKPWKKKVLAVRFLVCSKSCSWIRSFKCERNGSFYFKISNSTNRCLSRIKPIPFLLSRKQSESGNHSTKHPQGKSIPEHKAIRFSKPNGKGNLLAGPFPLHALFSPLAKGHPGLKYGLHSKLLTVTWHPAGQSLAWPQSVPPHLQPPENDSLGSQNASSPCCSRLFSGYSQLLLLEICQHNSTSHFAMGVWLSLFKGGAGGPVMGVWWPWFQWQGLWWCFRLPFHPLFSTQISCLTLFTTGLGPGLGQNNYWNVNDFLFRPLWTNFHLFSVSLAEDGKGVPKQDRVFSHLLLLVWAENLSF